VSLLSANLRHAKPVGRHPGLANAWPQRRSPPENCSLPKALGPQQPPKLVGSYDTIGKTLRCLQSAASGRWSRGRGI